VAKGGSVIDFKELSKIDVSNYIEKKGKLSYLSWPLMVGYLREHMCDATIQARKFEGGLPYILTPAGSMVETYIEMEDKELWSEWLPVMDNRNKAIKEPDMFEINKAIQRCKAKCISEYLGIGLYIYRGEDLPGENDPEPDIDDKVKKEIDKIATKEGLTKYYMDHKKYHPKNTTTFHTLITKRLDQINADAKAKEEADE